MLIEIIKQTPIYVWLLLAFLLQRGISASQEREVNVLKSLLVPGIFIVWGLLTIVTSLAHVYLALFVYVLFLCIGVLLGLKMYTKSYRFFLRNGAVIRAKNYISLLIILVNFVVKYALNIYMHINAEAVNLMDFNVLYTMISGTAVGLFFGGILVTYKYVTKQLGTMRGKP